MEKIPVHLNPSQRAYVLKWLRLPFAPPLLLTGSSGKKLEGIAQWISLQLACQTSQACLMCQSCRLVQAGSHPDVVVCQEESIKEIRATLKRTHTTQSGSHRLVIFPHIEQYSTLILNVILKSLEKPSAATRYLLYGQRISGLPRTVRSRCHVLYVGGEDKPASLSPESLAKLLESLEKTTKVPSDEQLEEVSQLLLQQGRTGGPTSALRRALLRLRDYHKVRDMQGGNEKLARDILVASLHLLQHNS